MNSEKDVQELKREVSKDWYQLSIEETLQRLKTSRKGLTSEEVGKRQMEYGLNTLPKGKPIPGFTIFLNQFKSPLVYILIIATGIATLLGYVLHAGDPTDALVIAAAVALNVIIGFYQERRAQRSLEALQRVITTHAHVLRDGVKQDVDIAELVPGDIIVLALGDKVPADCRLCDVASLNINESSLTGESLPVEKNDRAITEQRMVAEQTNMVFLGTVVVEGTGTAVVVATGKHTEIGAIASQLTQEVIEVTPLQKKLAHFSKILSYVVLVVALIIFVTGIIAGPISVAHVILMLETAVAVAVAAIPEGLVVAVTIILAVGMQRILKEKALVRKLLAAETLGSTTVICTDKTGTVTEGRMFLTSIVTEGYTLDEFKHGQALISKEGAEEFVLLLRIGVLCNDAAIANPNDPFGEWKIAGTPTDAAFLTAATSVGVRQAEVSRETPRLDTAPFNSTQKYMATLHRFSDSENIIYLKGAPERVLDFCKYIYTHVENKHKELTGSLRERVTRQYETMSRGGLRVLAVAYRKVDKSMTSFSAVQDLESEFVLVGMVGIKDVLRPTAKETIRTCQDAGIKVVMMTGDHRLTARAIGHELGLPVEGKNVLDGDHLRRLNESEFAACVSDISLYARVTPEDKLRIVKAWQSRGEVVAMTGDGVNDALALQKADIGVALGSGTEVAKETADLVLLDNDFSTIVTAVREGRVIYNNIKKVVLYFLSDSFAEATIILFSILVGWPLPILVSQILFINILADGLPALALTQEPADPDIMKQKPQERDKPILDKSRVRLILLISGVASACALVIFWFTWKATADIQIAQTMVFTFLVFKTLLFVFSLRSLDRPLWQTSLVSNPYLVLSVAIGIALQLAVIYLPFGQKIFHTVPLSVPQWQIILGACAAVIFMIEGSKYVKRFKK